MDNATLEREPILGALSQVLAWPEIARSPQLAGFLDYIVKRTLAGDEQSIKAYSIAVDVLGRSVDFDPQSDPIVRVQARRLRGLLEEYYRGPGHADPVRIGLPVGRYVPEFHTIDVPLDGAPALAREGPAPGGRARVIGGITLSWFVLAVTMLAILASGMALLIFRPAAPAQSSASVGLQPPDVTVVEFQNLVGTDSDAPKFAGLAIELVTDLAQFEDVNVHYGGGGGPNGAVSDGASSDYVLTGIVRLDRTLVQYSAILTDSQSGLVVWNHTVAIPLLDASQSGVLDEVSRQLSLILGSPRGPLHAGARALLAQAEMPEDQASLYLCTMLFHAYRDSAAVSTAAQTRTCLADLSEAEQSSAIGLAISSSLLAEQPQDPQDETTTPAERVAHAEAGLDQAVGLAPVSGFVWEQRARLRQTMGQFDLARSDYGSAIQLNPANGDALAGFARLLAFGGDVPGGQSMARDAVEGTPDPPDWYFGVPALVALRAGNNAAAIQNAVRYARADPELGPILAILAGQRGRNDTIVNRYLAQVLDVASFRAMGVLPRLQRRVQDAALLEQIRGSLGAAGVPEQALDGPF
ncbi:MAG: hypothetical protein ACOH2L_07215 [Devosia sp.]